MISEMIEIDSGVYHYLKNGYKLERLESWHRCSCYDSHDRWWGINNNVIDHGIDGEVFFRVVERNNFNEGYRSTIFHAPQYSYYINKRLL